MPYGRPAGKTITPVFAGGTGARGRSPRIASAHRYDAGDAQPDLHIVARKATMTLPHRRPSAQTAEQLRAAFAPGTSIRGCRSRVPAALVALALATSVVLAVVAGLLGSASMVWRGSPGLSAPVAVTVAVSSDNTGSINTSLHHVSPAHGRAPPTDIDRPLHTYYVLAGDTPVLVHNTGPCGTSLDDAISRGARTTSNFDEVARRLAQNHGIDPNVASDRLHAIKQANGLGGADNVVFDLTGNVWDPRTGDYLGSLTQGGAGSYVP